MGEQVLGGGVIFLVAVVLWLVYLLPSWHARHQLQAAERNAVRLNQALRVLAETTETPEEVRVELNARRALAQQKLARKAQSERDQAELEAARLAVETARRERLAARMQPEARRARARRQTRVVITGALVASLALAAFGGVQLAQAGSSLLLWVGAALSLASMVLLHRMSLVQRRAVVRTVVEEAAPAAPAVVPDFVVDAAKPAWTPRELPRPLSASAGSRAAAVLDGVAAQEALRAATVEEAMRRRAEAQRPPSIAAARAARVAELPREAATDDARIEAHVRDLLERRASGQ